MIYFIFALDSFFNVKGVRYGKKFKRQRVWKRYLSQSVFIIIESIDTAGDIGESVHLKRKKLPYYSAYRTRIYNTKKLL